MVLQRDHVQNIYGTTIPNSKVYGKFDSKEFSGNSDSNGNFSIPLPQLPAGGPYTLTITGDETLTYTDVLVGDVIICGGQSNMEYTMGMLIDRLGFNEVKEDEDFIRSFEVPKVYNFEKNIDIIEEICWQKAKGDSIRSFSAIGFYAAKKLYEKHGIPIGVITCNIGGTPAKSWCSQETIREMNLYVNELEQVLTPGYTKQVEEKDNLEEAQYLEMADKTFESPEFIEKGTVNFPGMFNSGLLSKLNGTVILKKTISLTKEQAAMKLDLHLGTMHDRDNTYVNGTFVGTTGYRYPTRRYHIPEGLLHEGENTIQVNLTVFRGVGGVDTAKELFIAKEGSMTRVLDLEGEWEYEIKKELPTLNDKTFFIYYPCGLYQAMLYPLRNFGIKAAMYYQGESNVVVNQVYDKELRAMINDWRKLFKNEDLPFVIIQLAGYCDGDLALNGDGWAILREKQNDVSHDKNNYLTQAYDLGEFNDIHPCKKKEVGLRVADTLESFLYPSEENSLKALNPKAFRVEKNTANKSIEIHFTDFGDGLKTTNNSETVNNIQAVTSNGEKIIVQGKLQNNILYIKDNDFKEISYAWMDCAFDINLYGENGLPVIPFKFAF